MRDAYERREGRTSPLSRALDKLLAHSEGRVKVRERLAALVWRECVGDFYADRTSVTKVHRGIMYVWCRSPALAHQLSLDAEEILRRVNREVGGRPIREIRPSTTRRGTHDDVPEVGVPGPAPGPSKGEFASIQLTPADVAEIDSEAALIPNEDLRARFRTAAISERRARKWKLEHGYHRCRACGWLVPPGLERCTQCEGQVG